MRVEHPKIHSVKELTLLIKRDLENAFSRLWVMGEITNFKKSPTGHFYFDLKDEVAQISVALFKGMALKMNLAGILGLASLSQLDDFRTVQAKVNGKKVKVFGSISVYEKSGRYNLIAEIVEMEGLGSLQQQFEELKKKLHSKGYFEHSRKRTLPEYPSSIGIVTSPTGAAIRDMLNILKRRWPDIHVILYPSLVQGKEAAADLVQGIRIFNHYRNVDLIIIGRGGGSIEDLWAFNEEIVADAIYESSLPVVSAVGHEVDFTIADFTADLRAPTPSAAAELVVKVKSDVLERIHQYGQDMEEVLKSEVSYLREKLVPYSDSHLKKSLLHAMSLFKERIKACSERKMAKALVHLTAQYDLKLGHVSEKLLAVMQKIRIAWENSFQKISDKLNLLDPLDILKRGYSVTYEVGSGRIIRDGADISEGGLLRTVLHKGELISRVERGAEK